MQMGGTKMNKKSKNAPQKGIVEMIKGFLKRKHNNDTVNISIWTAGTCSYIGRFLLFYIIGIITVK